MKHLWKTILIVLMFSTLLISCNANTYHWKFEKETSEVVKIEIVDAEDAYTYTVIKELDLTLIAELYADIENLEMTRYGTNLKHPCEKCFLITFQNNEYDIISATEPKHVRYDEDNDLVGYNSWFKCNQEQFDALLEKYMSL